MVAQPLVTLPSQRRTLAALAIGEEAVVADLAAASQERLRLLELGFVPGTKVRLIRKAPLGDPLEVELRGYRLSLQRREAAAVLVKKSLVHALPPPSYTLQNGTLATTKPTRFFVLGNPNCGKSTLFSALSGRHVRIANHPGITVDAQAAELSGSELALVDLPGCYSLSGAGSPEEALAANTVIAANAAAILVVLDATALERGLYLALQALELGRPMICAVNLLDEAERSGLSIDLHAMSEWLGVPCIGTVATKRRGLTELREALLNPVSPKRSAKHAVSDPEALCVARYAAIDRALGSILTQPKETRVRLTDRIDAVLTHPVAGSFVFIAVLVLMFSALFTLSQPMMDGITFVFDKLGQGIQALLPVHWLTDLVAVGLLSGVGTTLAFLPQIVLLLLFITVLESVGYLSRGGISH